MTAKENELLKRLEKRKDWLTTRIYNTAKDKEDLSHDRAEASALEWAIDILEKYLRVKEPECHHLWAIKGFNTVFCQRCLALEVLP